MLFVKDQDIQKCNRGWPTKNRTHSSLNDFITCDNVQKDGLVGELADPVARHEADVHSRVRSLDIFEAETIQILSALG